MISMGYWHIEKLARNCPSVSRLTQRHSAKLQLSSFIQVHWINLSLQIFAMCGREPIQMWVNGFACLSLTKNYVMLKYLVILKSCSLLQAYVRVYLNLNPGNYFSTGIAILILLMISCFAVKHWTLLMSIRWLFDLWRLTSPAQRVCLIHCSGFMAESSCQPGRCKFSDKIRFPTKLKICRKP